MPAAKSLARPVALGAIGLALAIVSLLVGLWVTLPDPAPLARENPRTTALIEQRRAEARARRRGFHVRQAWIGPDRIPPILVQAILASEDANFFGHDGFDWDAIRGAAERDLRAGRFARGASTITQQLAKNLWLGTEKSLWRKAKEAVLAAKLERALSKRRILSLYLNVAEWGPGTFGIEAGARDRFGVAAGALSTAQAVVLASMLPAPRRADLENPSRWLKHRSRRLLDRMRGAGRISVEEHRHASAELERILARRKATALRADEARIGRWLGVAPHEHDAGRPPHDGGIKAFTVRFERPGVIAAKPRIGEQEERQVDERGQDGPRGDVSPVQREAADEGPRRREGGGPEEDPGKTHVHEDPGLLHQGRHTVPIEGRSLQLAREHHAKGMEHAPDRERPIGPVPNARHEERDEQVAVRVQRAVAAAAQGDVDVIAEPGGKADVPPRPEIAQPAGQVGIVEIQDQVEAHHSGQAAGHVGVAAEIEEDLPGKGEGGRYQRRGGVGLGVVVHRLHV